MATSFVSDLCRRSIEGVPARPPPQTDPAIRAGAATRAIDPGRGRDEAVRQSHGRWRGNASDPELRNSDALAPSAVIASWCPRFVNAQGSIPIRGGNRESTET